MCALVVGLLILVIPGTAAADTSPRSDAAATTTVGVASAAIEAAIAYGQAQVGVSLYTGCSAGAYRMGAMPSQEMHFDGRSCGQSYIYVLRPGWKGFDCSGLIYRMFQAAGVYFPYTSSSAMAALPAVPKSQIRRGDLLVKPGSHVAMYLGIANGIPWALEASPKQILEQSGIWRVAKGVMAVDARPYLNSSGYTARRVPGT
ncbi:MAG TPA: NlpC/P60 family protein [Pseudonocardiaceae bacterium]